VTPILRPANPSRPLVVVVNGKASGTPDADRLLSEVMRHVTGAGAHAVGRITASEDALREAVEEAQGSRLVLVGGDGTLHKALNLGMRLPEVALIPAGRANNVVRGLGMPRDVATAARVAATADARPLDVLRVESDRGMLWCVEALSAGIQADARSHYTGENSADLRAGVSALAGTVRRYHPYELDLMIDGRPGFHGQAAQVFLSNLPFFGFGFRVDPLARPADGLLEAIVVEAGSPLRVARLLLSAYRGTLLRRVGVTMRRAQEAVIRSPLPLTGDASPLGAGPASVTVEQGRLQVAS
jgi:diacylglycerol kinase family enzyme